MQSSDQDSRVFRTSRDPGPPQVEAVDISSVKLGDLAAASATITGSADEPIHRNLAQKFTPAAPDADDKEDCAMTQPPSPRSDPGRFLWDDDDELVCSPCMTCIHAYMDGPTCKAFPDGIPQDIIDMKNDHTQPYPGDHGIQYTPRAGAKRGFGW